MAAEPTFGLVDILMNLARHPPVEEMDHVFVREPVSNSGGGMTLSLASVEPTFPIENLQELTAATLLDYSMWQQDHSHRTDLLFNTQFPGSFGVEKLKSYFGGQYRLLSSITISSNNLTFSFGDPLDLDEIVTLMGDLGKEYTLEDAKGHRGRREITLMKDDVPLVSVSNYKVQLPHYKANIHQRLPEALHVSTELVTRIHQDIILEKGQREIHFDEYMPFLKLIFPGSYDDVLTPFLTDVRDVTLAGGIPTEESFAETKISKVGGTTTKQYRLNPDQVPHHLKYIIVEPETHRLLVGFKSQLDLSPIEEMLGSRGHSFGETEISTEISQFYIQKGGGKRLKNRRFRTVHQPIYDSQGSKIAERDGRFVITLDMNDHGAYTAGLEFLSSVYYDGLFFTSRKPDSNIHTSDISPEERMVVEAIDNLAGLYGFFLYAHDVRNAFQRGDVDDVDQLDPKNWLMNKLQESEDTSFQGRVLHVLNYLDSRLQPSEFPEMLGDNMETIIRANQLYGNLKLLKGRFEGMASRSD